MTRGPYDPNHPKIRRVEVYWTAVTYKTVMVYGALLLAVVLGVFYLFVPQWYSAAVHKLSNAVGDSDAEKGALSQNQAHFVNLDGKVQVKKVNSVQWVNVDYHTTLDKGDLVQAGSDGAARIEFGDRTTYTVKPDTLVTVEENLIASDRPTSVAVRISVGAVDLSTPNWASPNSKAAVSVEDAVAQLRPNSHAAVKSDPAKNEHEIVVSAGGAEVQRGSVKMELTQWEKASFSTGGSVQKSSVLDRSSRAEARLFPLRQLHLYRSPLHFSSACRNHDLMFVFRRVALHRGMAVRPELRYRIFNADGSLRVGRGPVWRGEVYRAHADADRNARRPVARDQVFFHSHQRVGLHRVRCAVPELDARRAIRAGLHEIALIKRGVVIHVHPLHGIHFLHLDLAVEIDEVRLVLRESALLRVAIADSIR